MVNSELNIDVTSQLPVHHEETVDYHCSRNHDKKGHVDATCQDGTISFQDQPTPCFKMGTEDIRKIMKSSLNLTLKCTKLEVNS